jgi:hypothetical protein
MKVKEWDCKAIVNFEYVCKISGQFVVINLDVSLYMVYKIQEAQTSFITSKLRHMGDITN